MEEINNHEAGIEVADEVEVTATKPTNGEATETEITTEIIEATTTTTAIEVTTTNNKEAADDGTAEAEADTKITNANALNVFGTENSDTTPHKTAQFRQLIWELYPSTITTPERRIRMK